MKKNTELWMLSHDDVKKGLLPAWEAAIVEVMNELVDYERPLRHFDFQHEQNVGNKSCLIEFVTEGNYLLVLEYKLTRDIIGTIMIRPTQFDNDMVGLLGFLYVAPKYRRQGFGKHLLMNAENVSKKMGCNLVRLSVLGDNTQAKRFYAAMQYRDTEIQMAKSI